VKRFLIWVLVGLVGLVSLAQELGTRENPIIWVFPPSTQPALIEEIAKKIAADIGKMTGLFIVPKVMPDYAALIEAFKAAEGNVMGVPTTDQYARISVETNFETTPRLAAVRYGYPYYFSSVYAPREKGFETAQDLNGTVWIYNDEGSTSGFKLPKMLFDKEGITFKGVVKSGGHTNSMVALLEGQGDFCTGYGSPPLPPEDCDGAVLYLFQSCLEAGEDEAKCYAFAKDALKACDTRWEYGNYPELWLWNPWKNELMPEEYRGKCVDLRRAAAKIGAYGDIWEIVQKIGVVLTIGPVPNDCIAFSPGFPKDIQDKIVEAIKQHIASPEGQKLWTDPNFYEWTAVEEIDDTYYCNYRELVGLPNPEWCKGE
jgi:phosphonate transport system substrate-binding protein